MLGSYRLLRQIAHVSVQIAQLHIATAFHFFISKRLPPALLGFSASSSGCRCIPHTVNACSRAHCVTGLLQTGMARTAATLSGFSTSMASTSAMLLFRFAATCNHRNALACRG